MLTEAVPAAQYPEVGETLGDFRLLAELGRGGMGDEFAVRKGIADKVPRGRLVGQHAVVDVDRRAEPVQDLARPRVARRLGAHEEPAAVGRRSLIRRQSITTYPMSLLGSYDLEEHNAGTTMDNEAELYVEMNEPNPDLIGTVTDYPTIEYMVEAGGDVFFEIGPGQALTGMVKRIAKGVTTIPLSNSAEIEKAANLVREMGLVHNV